MDIKIMGAYTQYAAPPAKGKQLGQGHAPGQKSQGDKVSISSRAGDYAAAMRAINSSPDIRASLVGNIREMLAGGAYSVSAGDVAESIFKGLGE